MGIFDRIGQVLKGKAGNAVSNIENKNPEAVYTAAIAEREKKWVELRGTTAQMVALRDRQREELEAATRELEQVTPAIAAAIEGGEDEAALVLLERKGTLEAKIGTLTREWESSATRAEEAKRALSEMKVAIDALKREKTEMIARNASADARIQIQETIDGLGTDADDRGLANIRENIERMSSDAELDTVKRPQVSEADLARIKAKAELARLKARKGGSTGKSSMSGLDAPADAAADTADATDLPKRTL